MEGASVDLLVKEIKERQLGVASLCHDDDSGTTKQFLEEFGPGKQDPPMKNVQGNLKRKQFSLPEQ